MIEQNNTAAAKAGREPLVIFPGFELDIRYHLICLFAPVTNGQKLQGISDILSNMGLVPHTRFSNGIPALPYHHGQCWSLREVLDKVQNECGGIVIAAHAFSKDGICNDPSNKEDFVKNTDLYALETSDWPPEGKAKQVLEGLDSHWKRPGPYRQPAAISASDGKSLENPANPNNLGYRRTWIKMSEPSIESLRQAFLDPDSRIHPNSEPPQVTHPHVRQIEISGNKFLQNQALRMLFEISWTKLRSDLGRIWPSRLSKTTGVARLRRGFCD